jgi:plastocyanin
MAGYMRCFVKTITMKHALTLLFVAATLGVQAQTTHELVAMDFEFDPDVINAVQGDSVHVTFMNTDHTFTEVSEVTWNANGDTPNGGYNFGPGLTEVTFVLDGTGTIFYVCVPHASMAMKGIIDVALGLEDHALMVSDAFYPNPANEQLWLREAPPDAAVVSFFDATGREVYRTSIQGDLPMSVGDLNSGLYSVRVADQGGKELFRQQVVVE